MLNRIDFKKYNFLKSVFLICMALYFNRSVHCYAQHQYGVEIADTIIQSFKGIEKQINLESIYFYQNNIGGDKFIALFAEKIDKTKKIDKTNLRIIKPTLYVEEQYEDTRIFLYTVIGYLLDDHWQHKVKYKTLLQDYGKDITFLLQTYLEDIKSTETDFFPIKIVVDSNYSSINIPYFSNIFDFDYDVFFDDDIFNILIHYSEFYCTNHYRIIDDNLNIVNKYARNHYKVSGFSKLYTSGEFYFVDDKYLYEIDLRNYKKTRLLTIPERSARMDITDIFLGNKNNYLIYENFDSEKKAVLDVNDGILSYRYYQKNFLLKFNERQVADSIMVQKGYKYCADFKSVSSNDTLYSVWSEEEEKFKGVFNNIPGGHVYRIMFNKYDGLNWLESVEIVNENKKYSKEIRDDSFFYPIGIFKLHEKLYIFWMYLNNSTKDKYSKVYYNWSIDCVNWSLPIEIVENKELLSSYNQNNSTLHLLIGNSNNEKYYYVFDGINFDNQGIIIKEKSQNEKIFANDTKTYILWETPQKKILKYKIKNIPNN
ncbi:MAG: hypothetical protein ISS16_07720 [Ignavibacteria bacterium]|nr:hypothetical protein [Ignavibacteria bacterium]